MSEQNNTKQTYDPKAFLGDLNDVYKVITKGIGKAETKDDPVNHPSHYTYGKIEVIDYIEDKQLDFLLGNVVKYVSRAGHKDDALQDLKKAAWYLNRKIMQLERALTK